MTLEKASVQEKSIEDVRFRATDAAVSLYEKTFGINPENAEAVREIFDEFFREQVEKTELVESKKYGVSYLHSEITAGDLAKRLYQRSGRVLPELKSPEKDLGEDKPHDEYIFSSFFSPKNPSALFVFFEQGLNQLVRELPKAMEHLERGEEPPKYAVHYVGTPTRDIGHITSDFVDELNKRNAFEVFGDMYSELVNAHAEPQGQVVLRGISMGAPFAIETANKLLAEGSGTQDVERIDKPRIFVRIDTPPSQDANTPERRRWQVQTGFVVDGIKGLLNDSMSRASANPFSGSLVEELKPFLASKGIHEEMAPEDERLKKRAIKKVADDFFKGIPIPEELKVTEVIGTSDTTMFLPFSEAKREVKDAAAAQRSEFGGSLGENIISEDGNRRTFAISTSHALPNTTPTNLGRLDRAAKLVAKLKKAT
jgi:hypothetical protein